MRKNKDSAAVPFLAKDGTRSVIASVICILGGILVGFVVLLLLAVFVEDISFSDAFVGLVTILGGPFSSGSFSSSLFQLGNMLFQTTPLIMTGLSVAVAFKTGLFNIGAPGQYLMGAMASLIVALSLPDYNVPAAVVDTGVRRGHTRRRAVGLYSRHIQGNARRQRGHSLHHDQLDRRQHRELGL